MANNLLLYVHSLYKIIMPNIPKVSIGQLRSNLANYLNSNEPIAIMRHGQTIGYYVPASVEESAVERESLKQAVSRLDGLLQERVSYE
jgi:hypothetical protein